LLVASFIVGSASLCAGEPTAFGSPSKGDTLQPGDPAPVFVMRDLQTDNPTFLRDYVGTARRRESKIPQPHVVVLSFWATWCQPCKVEIPLLTELEKEFVGKPVKIFLVNTQEMADVTEDTVRAVYKARGYSLQCLIDASGRFARNYTVRGLPMIVVIDQDGIVRKVNRGYHENFHIEIRNLVNELLTAQRKN
jgi:thiol-disulfide isomerase/thioredoxin